MADQSRISILLDAVIKHIDLANSMREGSAKTAHLKKYQQLKALLERMIDEGQPWHS